MTAFGHLLSIHEVIELRLVFFRRLFDSAYHFRSFPSARPERIHVLSGPGWLIFRSLLFWAFLSCYQRVVVPPYAPYQLHSNSCSYQDSAQAQPRQRICGCGNLVDPSQGSSGDGEGGLSSLEGFDHCHPFFLQGVPEQRGRWSLLSGRMSPVTAMFSSSFLGSPIQSLTSVMMQGVLLFGVSWNVFLGHPARPYSVSAQAALLLASCRFGGQYTTIAVMLSCQH